MVQEFTTEVTRLNSVIAEIRTGVPSDHNRLNAMEGALPERLHRCEERQAHYIEFLNSYAKHASEQISTLQYRVNPFEQSGPPSGIPNVGGSPT